MSHHSKTILGLLALSIVPVIAIAAYLYLVVFSESHRGEVRLEVVQAQFQQHRALAERYRSRLLDYAGMCDDIGLPPQTACQATDTRYRISQPLPDGTYYCMDTAGFKGVTENRPQGIVCP